MAQDPADQHENVDLAELDVAVAHWHVRAWGGAEYLVTKLAEVVDAESVYTLGEPDPDVPNPYGNVDFMDVTGVLDYPRIRRVQRMADRVFEYAQWEDVDWREVGDPDVLVTSGATTRAVITPDDTLHVNYCHSPSRWFYDLYHDRKRSLSGVLIRPLIRHLRMRDVTVDPRVDYYFANSPVISRRIHKYYQRGSEVLYPPLETHQYRNEDDGGYYLHLGRLDEEKGVAAVVEAFEESTEQLILAGGRGDVDDAIVNRIERAQNIEWRGFVDEGEKLDLLARCTAVVFNGRNEDFGIVPIEANASGKPALVRNDGFPGMYVEDGVNGYVHDGTPADIRAALHRLERTGVTDPADGVDRFDMSAFETHLRREIEQAWTEIVDIE